MHAQQGLHVHDITNGLEELPTPLFAPQSEEARKALAGLQESFEYIVKPHLPDGLEDTLTDPEDSCGCQCPSDQACLDVDNCACAADYGMIAHL